MTTSPQTVATATSAEDLEKVLEASDAVARRWASTTPAERAAVLDSVADALDGAGDRLVPVGMEDTNLPEPRLRGELKRTSFQLRLFGEVLRDGGYLDARVDHADADWPMGAPRPDLRRSYRALGPVAVYAASNFPFAFSVAGGDTASALAAGNPVIVKVHDGHVALSIEVASVVKEGLAAAGAPADLLNIVFGRDAATALVQDRRIRAAGFTGSIPGGRALMDLAVSRPDPIPFYGELGSNNPAFVTVGAAEARAAEIVDEFVGSFTMGAGQFCTKPGTLFVPKAAGMAQLLAEVSLPDGAKLLNQRIQDGYVETLEELRSHSLVRVLNEGGSPLGDPPAPTVLATDIRSLLSEPEALQTECFGPTALVVEYDDEDQLLEAAESFEGQLTATIIGEETCDVAALVEVLAGKAGRVLWNQWPTGVSVTYAQQHGGPYPATTAAGTTSVGTAAIERFQRPVAYQNFPDHLLPTELREDNPAGVPRLVDGRRVAGDGGE